MRKLSCVLITLTVLAFLAAPSLQARIAPMRVVFISGSAEYDSDKTMPILKKYLEDKYPSLVTMLNAKQTKEKDDLPGLEALEKCEVAVLFTRRLKLEGDQLERIKKYTKSGKPIVGIRTASHGIQTYLDIDKEVWGGNYKNHYKVGPVTEVKFVDNSKDHPILKDVMPFKSSGSLYRNTGLSKDVTVLLNGTTSEATEPIAWTRMVNNGRVFYTSLGAQKDFEEENFLRMMSNAIVWAAGRAPRTK
jgi:type 1 glutamine amidotransferase